MSTRRAAPTKSKPSGVVRMLPWVGIAALSFVAVTVVLAVTEDDDPARAQQQASARDVVADVPEREAATAVVLKPKVAGPLGDGPEAESIVFPAGEVPDAAPSEEDRLDAQVAQVVPGIEVAPNAAVDIPAGVIERVEGSRDWVVHKAVEGESVEQIAYRYAVRSEALRMWNGIKSSANRVRPGSRLRIKARQIAPPRVLLEYFVQPGDSWWVIGTRYGVDSADLRKLNRDSPQHLAVGQKLRIWVDPVVFEWVATEDDPTDAEKIRPGAVGIGPPQKGRLVNGVKLPASDYYVLKLPPSSYGTTHAVETILRGIVLFKARTEYEQKLIFGSMSAKHGGPLQGHRSHQSGRDLDIRLPLLAKYPEWFPVEPKRVDWLATWQLVSAMAETDEVVAVFLDYAMQKRLYKAATRSGATEEERKQFIQYPRGPKAHLGLVRHSPGHLAHVHVRVRCGPYEVECSSPRKTVD